MRPHDKCFLFTCPLTELMLFFPALVVVSDPFTQLLFPWSPQNTHSHDECLPVTLHPQFCAQKGHFCLVPWSPEELMDMSAQHACLSGTGPCYSSPSLPLLYNHQSAPCYSLTSLNLSQIWFSHSDQVNHLQVCEFPKGIRIKGFQILSVLRSCRS